MTDIQPPPKTVQEAPIREEKPFTLRLNLSSLGNSDVSKYDRSLSNLAHLEFMFAQFGSWNIGWSVSFLSNKDNHFHINKGSSAQGGALNSAVAYSDYDSFKTTQGYSTGPRIDFSFEPTVYSTKFSRGFYVSLLLEAGVYKTDYNYEVVVVTNRSQGSCAITNTSSWRQAAALLPVVGYQWKDPSWEMRIGGGLGAAKSFGIRKATVENTCPQDEFTPSTSAAIAQKLQSEVDGDESSTVQALPWFEVSVGYSF